jgi:hypothetical protein
MRYVCKNKIGDVEIFCLGDSAIRLLGGVYAPPPGDSGSILIRPELPENRLFFARLASFDLP